MTIHALIEVLDSSGLIGLQLTLLVPNLVSASCSALTCNPLTLLVEGAWLLA